MQKIVLASGSPRRREILELMGLDFEITESGFDEEKIKTDDVVELVEELALQKVLTVANDYPDAIIVGGDTMVAIPGESGYEEILGKANNRKEAKEMFAKLLGKTHRVVTGVAVINSLTGETYVGSEEGTITFREGTEEELAIYTGLDKNWKGFAGAYAMQGGAAPFVISQGGVMSAIIGMPVELTAHLLEQAGVIVEADPKEVEIGLADKQIGIE